MITLTWGNLRDFEFKASLGKLYAKPMGYSEGMRFALMGREIKKQQTLCDETHTGILKKYGIPDTEKPGVFTIPEANRETYAKEMEKLDATKFEVRVNRFDALKLSETIEFSPQDLMLLEPILLPFEIPELPAGNVTDIKAATQPTPPPSH